MQDVIDQPVASADEAASAEAPPPSRSTTASNSGSALRDLVELSASSAATEARSTSGTRNLPGGLIQEGRSRDRGAVQPVGGGLSAEHQRRVGGAGGRRARDECCPQRTATPASESATRWSRPSATAKSARSAVWMGESVFEAADQTIKAEAKKSKEIYDGQRTPCQPGGAGLADARHAPHQDSRGRRRLALPLRQSHGRLRGAARGRREHVAKLNRVKAGSSAQTSTSRR